MLCDICGKPIEGNHRELNLEYLIKEIPPKINPFRETKKTTGFLSFSSGDLWFGGSTDYKELGIETSIICAKICSECEPKIDAALKLLKEVFTSDC